MNAIGNIYLTWRKGKGHRRIIIGVVKRNVSEGTRFTYIKQGVEDAKKDGFTGYTDFPNFEKTYTENVIDIFGQRLTKSERSDIQKYYDFWNINPKYKEDKYYLLAHTQGMLATDNFEFLAEYFPIQGLSFVSEICGLSHSKHAPNVIQEDDVLNWKFDNKNNYDHFAIAVYKGENLIGFVKAVHCKVFYKNGGDKLKIKVRSIEKNGNLNRVFIQISF